jgi:ubiquinone/menaquinone biosynthesis C-methylase UbiE
MLVIHLGPIPPQTTMTIPSASASDHYQRTDLAGAILAGLRAAGKDPAALAPTDLAPVDQFHIGARDATLALLGLAQLPAGLEVLDVGGGLGGAARTLATETGARVTVLDLTPEYVRTGALLTERTGLASQVRFRQGDATQMPFPDGSFDAVWTQHSSMNIADKEALYREAYRVLRPGGKLALHEIMAGPQPQPYFPEPWATDPAHSHLRPPAEVRALLQRAGFRELAWKDLTAEARAWWRRRMEAAAAHKAPPPLGIHLLLGPAAPTIMGNLMRSLDEDRVSVIQGVFERA